MSHDGYKAAPKGTFLDLNGTAVGDIQRLGKFLREEFKDGGQLHKHAVDEAIARLRELKNMRYYKAVVDELDEETRAAAVLAARKRGVIERLQPKDRSAEIHPIAALARLFSKFPISK